VIYVGVVVLAEDVLVDKCCDFQECLWRGETEFRMLMNNWRIEPFTVSRDQQVGTIELFGVVVPQVDPVWEDTSEVQVWLCTTNLEMTERQSALQEQLQVGEHLSDQSLEEVLLAYSDVFAFTDKELGETDLVTHSINRGDAKPVKTLPQSCPMPYARNWKRR